MEIERIAVSVIEVGERRRHLDQEKAKALSSSIAEIGLKTPISVRLEPIGDPLAPEDHRAVLVAGLHRLEACRMLGLVDIDAFVFDGDEINARLWEIDENLMRAELTDAQRAEHVAERKRIYEAMHPETAYGGDRRGPSRQFGDLKSVDRFTADTAAKTGRSERAVQRDAQRGERLGADLQLVAGTCLDKGVELDALAKLSPDERRPLIEQARAGQPVSARKAPATIEYQDADEQQFEALQRAWNRASASARERFLAWVEDNESPVFGRGRQ